MEIKGVVTMSDSILINEQITPDLKMAIPYNTEDNEGTPKPEYKKLVVKLENPLSQEETALLNKIHKKFSKNGFQMDIQEFEIVLYLHSIDFTAFKTYIHSLLSTTNSEFIDKMIFLNIIEKISRIKSYGIKGGKRFYVTYNDERKVENRQSKANKRGLYYYAQKNNFSKKNTSLPEKFENLITCKDSEEFLKELPDNCIDLIITSPPYNFGFGYDTSKDGIDWEKYSRNCLIYSTSVSAF